MLVRASGFIQPGFLVISLGHSYTYGVVSSAGRVTIFDPGSSSTLDRLVTVLSDAGIALASVTDICITHLHPERISALPWIKTQAPKAVVRASVEAKRILDDRNGRNSKAQECVDFETSLVETSDRYRLPLSEYSKLLKIDRAALESEMIDLGNEIAIRPLPTPGHAPESIAYLVSPFNNLVVDEGFGYYNGRELSAPGCDWSISDSMKSIQKIKDLLISGICFPNTGMITGSLIEKHVASIIQNTDDLVQESLAALKAGTSPENVDQAIYAAFYNREGIDPIFKASLDRTYRSICEQIANSRP